MAYDNDPNQADRIKEMRTALDFVHQTETEDLYEFIRGLTEFQQGVISALGALIQFAREEYPEFALGVLGKYEEVRSE
jgi:hypothetical protein